MPKWKSERNYNGDYEVITGRSLRGVTFASPVGADMVVNAHNADIDALTAERDELQRRLTAVVATDHYQRSLDEIHLRYNMEVQRDEFKRRLDDVVALLEPAPDEKLQKMYAEDLHVEYALRELYPRAVAIAEGREG